MKLYIMFIIDNCSVGLLQALQKGCSNKSEYPKVVLPVEAKKFVLQKHQ